MNTKPMKVRRADKRPAPEVQHDEHVNAWLAHHVRSKKPKPSRPPRPKPAPFDPLAKMQEELDRIGHGFLRAPFDYREIIRWLDIKAIRKDYDRLDRLAKDGCASALELRTELQLFLTSKVLAWARISGYSPVDYYLAMLWARRIPHEFDRSAFLSRAMTILCRRVGTVAGSIPAACHSVGLSSRLSDKRPLAI